MTEIQFMEGVKYRPAPRDHRHKLEDIEGGDSLAFNRGRILTGGDVFALPAGGYVVSSVQYAEMIANLPEVHPCTILAIGTPGQPVKSFEVQPHGRAYAWRTSSEDISGAFMDWWKVEPSSVLPPPGGEGLAPYAQHTIRQSEMLRVVGGPVDTGGLGAVAWRIDHGFKNFRDVMLPIFRAAGIVPMITYNPRDWDRPENAGVTPAEVNQWVSDGWVEISNHAASHTSATGNDAIEDQIVNGLAEIEAELPAARGKVFGFCVAGSGGYTDDTGGTFTNGDTPEQWGTHAGKLILENHAVGFGYLPGTDLRVLDGTPRDGMSHLGTDTRPASEVIAKIDQAIAQRKGLQIMSHPSNLGNEGYHNAASIQQIVDYIVTKRNAGELAVLTSYEMMVADSTRVAVSPRDTGTLTVTSTFPEVTNGSIQVRRVGDTVHVTLYDVEFANSTPPEFFYLAGALPPGYRPASNTSFAALADVNGTVTRRIRFQANGQILLYGITPSSRINVTASYLTPNAWPA